MTNKDTIVCLIGESGSGKTEVAKELELKGYNIIHSYTTRQAREENEWGHTFVSRDEITFNKKCSIVAFKDPYNSFHEETVIAYTKYNNYEYWATKEQYAGKGVSIYIIDPAGVQFLKEILTDTNIVCIFLNASYGIRAERLYERDGHAKGLERLNHDIKAFEIVQTDWVVNTDVKTPYEITKIIEKII